MRDPRNGTKVSSHLAVFSSFFIQVLEIGIEVNASLNIKVPKEEDQVLDDICEDKRDHEEVEGFH